MADQAGDHEEGAWQPVGMGVGVEGCAGCDEGAAMDGVWRVGQRACLLGHGGGGFS
jgi:hypothetical protein